MIAAALGGLAAQSAEPPKPKPPQLAPAAGRYLVATDRIASGLFSQTVVFLVDYSEDGAMGLIVNRPTETPMEGLVPGAQQGQVYLGGPISQRYLMTLFSADAPPEKSKHITGNVFLTSDEATLRAIAESPDASARLRVYAGYAGWWPGQLDDEIERGQWIVARAPTDAIFDAAPESLWEKFHRRFHQVVTQRREAATGSAPAL